MTSGEGWLALDLAVVALLSMVALLEFAAIRSPAVRDSRGTASARWLICVGALALAGRGVYALVIEGDWRASPFGMLPIAAIALGLCWQLLERVTRRGD